VTKRTIITTGLTALGCVTLVWVLLPRRSSVPTPAGLGFVYQGRTIQDWVNSVRTANKDENPEIESVVAIGAPAVPYLVMRLEDRSSFLVRGKLYRRAWMALPARLQGILPSPPPLYPPMVREGELGAVAYTLGQIGPEAWQAVPALIQIAGDRKLHPSPRTFAVSALAQIGPAARSSVPTLLNCLKDKHSDAHYLSLRTQAARALARIGEPEPRAIPQLELLLTSTNAFARSMAVVALWRMDPCRSNAALVWGFLQSPDPNLRRNTATGLGNVGEPAACFAPMLQALLVESNDVSGVAEFALGQILKSSTNKP
jgi:HEAT repeat protein